MDISVIIPVYKVNKFIGKSIQSIVNQSCDNYEIILVDDCGEDGSIELASNILEANISPGRYKIIKHSCNMGVSVSRNTGFENSTGDYIIHLDSDDYFEHDLLEKLFFAIKKNDAQMAICSYCIHKSNSEKGEVKSFSGEILTTDKQKLSHFKGMLEGKNTFALWNKMFSRKLWESSGAKFRNYLVEDFSTSPLLIMNSSKSVIISDPLIHYVQYNTKSVSTSVDYVMRVSSTIDFLELQFKDYSGELSPAIIRYKVVTKRKLMLHPHSDRNMQKISHNLFPELNPVIKGSNIPEPKLHYRLLLKLSVSGYKHLFNLYRHFLMSVSRML